MRRFNGGSSVTTPPITTRQFAVPYDHAQYAFRLVEQRGWHLPRFSREHKHGRYVLTVTFPGAVPTKLVPYLITSKKP